MWILLAVIVGVPLLVLFAVFAAYFQLWIQVKATHVPIDLLDLPLMRLRGVDPDLLVNVAVSLHKAGLQIPREQLEAHLLAGGNLEAVANALISAEKAGLNVGFREIAAIDLAGRDVEAAVISRVNPKIISCPPPGSGQQVITGVCQDGIRLGARARVTVRADLSKIVGGAGEETIIARVGEGIVAAIGRANSHREILQHPERITEYLLERGLDSGTCFEIVSADIADVDVIKNIGAELQSNQAEADKRMARARAEVRRAAAVAAHQEMKSRTVDMHSRVVAASAELPYAVASSLGEGNLGAHRPWRPSVHHRLRWRLFAS